MKKLLLKSIIPVLTVAAFAVASASASAPQASPLKGLWDSQVTLTDCQGHTLAVFRAFELFNAGGTLTSTDNTPPTGHGPGLGTWHRANGHTYEAPFQFFNFNSDGSFAGVQKIDRDITLSADGYSYTSVVTFQTLDPDGNVVFSGCGSESATRVP